MIIFYIIIIIIPYFPRPWPRWRRRQRPPPSHHHRSRTRATTFLKGAVWPKYRIKNNGEREKNGRGRAKGLTKHDKTCSTSPDARRDNSTGCITITIIIIILYQKRKGQSTPEQAEVLLPYFHSPSSGNSRFLRILGFIIVLLCI